MRNTYKDVWYLSNILSVVWKPFSLAESRAFVDGTICLHAMLLALQRRGVMRARKGRNLEKQWGLVGISGDQWGAGWVAAGPRGAAIVASPVPADYYSIDYSSIEETFLGLESL